VCLHHRELGSAQHGALGTKFRGGVIDYLLGSHPVWELFRTVYQTTRRPWLIGGLTLLAGYTSAMVRRLERPVSPELVAFRRKEQMQRLRAFLTRAAGRLLYRHTA
jgi:poly-beta-1,6-N-acetyl-D-glucosamine synthase